MRLRITCVTQSLLVSPLPPTLQPGEPLRSHCSLEVVAGRVGVLGIWSWEVGGQEKQRAQVPGSSSSVETNLRRSVPRLILSSV